MLITTLLPASDVATGSPPACPLDALTRREFVIGGAALAALIAGCGSGDGESAGTTGPDTRAFVGADGTTVQLPARAERVVALSDIGVAAQMIELGVLPAGMVVHDGEFHPYVGGDADLSAVTPVGGTYEPDLEAIAALDPDLIIATRIHEDLLNQLRAISTTVVFDHTRPLHELMTVMAEIIGVSPGAVEALDSDYRARLTRIRDEVSFELADVKVSYVSMMPDSTDFHWWYPDAGTVELEVLRSLGLDITSPGKDGQVTEVMSAERLSDIDADVILYYPSNLSGRVSDLPNHALWRALRAVQAGQAFELGSRNSGPTYAQARRFLDVVEAGLLAPEFQPDLF